MKSAGDRQLLVEKIIRDRIYETAYWKQHCFHLNAASLLDKAVQLESVGGCVPVLQPTPFICLLFKMLLIGPDWEIVKFMLDQMEFKYLRALAAFVVRLLWGSEQPALVYSALEPLLNDYRKLRFRSAVDGSYTILHMDEFVDALLRDERCCDIILPRLVSRAVLEDSGQLEARQSLLQDLVDGDDSDGSDVDDDIESSTAALKFKQNSNPSQNAVTAETGSGDLSVDETNRLRASLGLKPLK